MESIAILSALVRNENNLNKLIRGVNISLKHLCKVYDFDFICNDSIGKDLPWRDSLHLAEEVTSFVAINFLNFLNIYHEHGYHSNLTNWQPILSKSLKTKPETQNTTFKGHLSYITIVFPDLRDINREF